MGNTLIILMMLSVWRDGNSHDGPRPRPRPVKFIVPIFRLLQTVWQKGRWSLQSMEINTGSRINTHTKKRFKQNSTLPLVNWTGVVTIFTVLLADVNNLPARVSEGGGFVTRTHLTARQFRAWSEHFVY